MRGLWRRTRPEVVKYRARVQALCLEYEGHHRIARRWFAAWSAISPACHYHQRPIVPGLAELSAWHSEAAEIIDELSMLTVDTR